jgi:predicted nucleic acid-binding protein
VIVADTGAIVALIDADDRHHRSLRALFEAEPGAWVLPWAILPEVDYLLAAHVGPEAEAMFLEDLAGGAYAVEWGEPEDLERARELAAGYRDLGLGLVDGAVIAVAERLGAEAIATLDLRHFAAVEIRGRPRLLPRDQGACG